MRDTINAVKQLSDRLSRTCFNDPIEDLELSARTYNRLKKAGVNTVGELLRLSLTGEINNIRGVNQDFVEEVHTALEEKGKDAVKNE